jgi:hypothetical protein
MASADGGFRVGEFCPGTAGLGALLPFKPPMVGYVYETAEIVLRIQSGKIELL